MKYQVRETRESDIPAIQTLCSKVYPGSPSWTEEQLKSHLKVFPEGQAVAVDDTGRVLGMSSSLIVFWDDYDMGDNWRDFTDTGFFTNHDPDNGKTLYGAEIMVDPNLQGRGIGKALYARREKLVRDKALKRIRAGARLRGYHQYASQMSPKEYVGKVVAGELSDPTLSFQLRHGFKVLAIASGYLRHDPESLGYAAVIEWSNPDLKS